MTDLMATKAKDNTNYKGGYKNRKNLMALRDLTAVKLAQLHLRYPEWGLKDALAEIVKNYPCEMPSEVLLQMIQFIAGQWQELEANEIKKAAA